jgi:chromosome segregation ATPase
MQALQNTLKSQEDKLKRAEDAIATRENELSKKDNEIKDRLAQIEATKAEIAELRVKQVEKLEKIGGLTKEKAKDILLEAVDKKLARDVAERIRIAEDEIKETVEDRGRDLLIDAMYHGLPSTSPSSLSLPSRSLTTTSRVALLVKKVVTSALSKKSPVSISTWTKLQERFASLATTASVVKWPV